MKADVRGCTLDKDDYLLRLRKIEGQVRALRRLIEDDTYCIDILTRRRTRRRRPGAAINVMTQLGVP
jgi:DNA-binding FrmR family transcriptional regulator